MVLQKINIKIFRHFETSMRFELEVQLKCELLCVRFTLIVLQIQMIDPYFNFRINFLSDINFLDSRLSNLARASIDSYFWPNTLKHRWYRALYSAESILQTLTRFTKQVCFQIDVSSSYSDLFMFTERRFYWWKAPES